MSGAWFDVYVPSQEISDMLLAGLKEMEKEEKKETKRKKKK